MTAWFNALSQRERLLIAAMGALIVVLILLVGVIRPLHAWRADGRVALESARTTALYVDQAVAAAGGEGGGQPVTGADLRNLITASAGRSNIPVSAFQLSQSGTSVVISVSGISTARLYGWLGTLAQADGIIVSEARIARERSGEGVQARLTLTHGGGQ